VSREFEPFDYAQGDHDAVMLSGVEAFYLMLIEFDKV